MRTVCVKVDEEMLRRVDWAAFASNRSRSEVVRIAVMQYLEGLERVVRGAEEAS